ncbi:MAG: hypothetical protein WCK96_01445 [Methylococcales bacterium]
MAERLAVDVCVDKETEVLGSRWDDKYPCDGKRITRIEFNKAIKNTSRWGLGGRGDAYPDDTTLPDVNVHCWADMYTKVSYCLKVWVED